MTLPILYADPYYVAVNKPAGLAVHKSKLVRNTREFVLQTLRNQINCHIYPVHRLDRPTSGLLIFALSPDAAARLAQAFTQRSVQKNYLAIVRGFAPRNGQIQIPLQNHAATDTLQEAQTDYQRLAYIELPVAATERYPTSRYSLLKVCPHTGRMHQIRRHFNYINHPVIGDNEHGDYRHNRFFAQQLNCPELLLHAHLLVFRHPYTHVTTSITAPLPLHWQRICTQFGWQTVLNN